jgi:hypothetical protein
MIKKLLIIGLAFLVEAVSCRKDTENCHHHIFLTNNSSKRVYLLTTVGYPDTMLRQKDNYNPSNNPTSLVEPHQKGSDYSGNCLESHERDTLMLFIFDARILETISWDSVKAKNLYLKRYDLSLQDLQTQNWQLTFP